MGILIDSTVFIEVERRGLSLETILQYRVSDEAYLSVISLSELFHGVHRARDTRRAKARADLIDLILQTYYLLIIDESIAHIHAKITAELTSSGKMIGINDSWIAATCLAHQLSIATANVREFYRVPGLIVENWKV